MLTNLFKRPVTVIRSSVGNWANGYWLKGDDITEIIMANVQPVPAIVMETLPEGYRTKSAFILYTNTELNTSQDDESTADVVLLYGDRYLVTKKEIWGNTLLSHYEIIVVKEGISGN